ncbi:MAG: EutN/CcmL family microcompartment protein [Myxococcales bacterium]|nr:EutN/CcmL family microcompartment protein [Myxococcales bacterium]
MKLCLVTGTVVATVKHPAYIGQKLLSCQPLDSTGAPQGAELLAVDRVQAGTGDRVLVNQEGNGSRQMLGTLDGKLPIRSVIIGIVDDVAVDPLEARRGV